MRGWLVALRIARREARRHKGRTALIVAMIAIPVFGLSYAAVTFDMKRLTPAERVSRLMGAADAAVAWMGDGPITPDPHYDVTHLDSDDGSHPASALTPLLPAGATVSEYWTSTVVLVTSGGIADMPAYGIDGYSPLTTGLYRLLDGRMPATAEEIAVTPGALARMGAHVGDAVHTGLDGTHYTLVGVAEVGGAIDDAAVFSPRRKPVGRDWRGFLAHWLVGQPGPVTVAEQAALNAHGISVLPRAVALDPPRPPTETGSTVAGFSTFGLGLLVAGLAIAEVGLLAGSAFAVGARGRQRDLALIATNGGPPSALRRIVLADGAVAGLCAAAVGLAAGVAVSFSTRSFVEEHLFRVRLGGYRANTLWLAGIAGVGVLTGLLAAAVPAFTAARQDVIVVLTGRRGATRSRKRWLLLGIGVTALGVVGATVGAYQHDSTVVLAGLLLGEGGLVLCTPSIVGVIARVGRWLPVTPRMALRDASRRRAAAAPAISAVMAAVAGSVALTIYLSAAAGQEGTYAPGAPIGTVAILVDTRNSDGSRLPADTAALTAAVHDVLPGTPTLPFDRLECGTDPFCELEAVVPADRACPYSSNGLELPAADQRKARADARCNRHALTYSDPFGPVVTDDPATVAALTGLDGTALDEAVATLRSGGVLVSDARYVENGQVIVVNGPAEWFGPPELAPVVERLTVPGYVVTTGVYLVNPIASPKAVAAFGLTHVSGGIVFKPADRPSVTVLDRLRLEVAPSQSYISYEGGDTRHPSSTPLLLAIAAAVVALGAAAVATGLAAADSRRDLVALGAVGASPLVRRTMSLAQSGIISGVGSLIGAAAGFGAAAAILTGLNQVYAGVWPAPDPYPITVPWTNLAVSLLVVPAIAMLGAGLLTRSRLPSERRAD